MVQRCLAMLLLLLLAVLPTAGEASAFVVAEQGAPAVQALAAVHSGDHPAIQQDCDHGAAHRQLPCTMTASCNMAGCMALTDIVVPQVMSGVQHLAFRPTVALRLDGLALVPPLEPPRA
jgi:hypothetical protein